MFDDTHHSLVATLPSGPPPPVASVGTPTELRGYISAIYTCSFFHLFDEEKQPELGERLAVLLDPRPGSIIFGSHLGMPAKGHPPDIFKQIFCHSPESWTQLWEEQIFEKGQVRVNAVLEERDAGIKRRDKVVPVEEGTKSHWFFWSVERL